MALLPLLYDPVRAASVPCCDASGSVAIDMRATPILTSYRPPRRRRRAAMTALLVVVLGAVAAALLIVAFGESRESDRGRMAGLPPVSAVFAPRWLVATGGGSPPSPVSPSRGAVLRAGSDPHALPGNVLIADRGNNRLVEVSPG